jgi:phosphate transport system substrate-binding protein
VSGEGLSRIETAPPDLARGNPTIWALLVLVILGLGAAGIAIVRASERGPRPPFLVQPPVSPVTGEVHRDPDLLRLAGSGSNLPVTRALADAFSASHPDAHVVVHASIGSTGGIRAAKDGAIDVGLVSRELEESERRLGLRLVPYADVAVVFAANRSVPERDLGQEDVLELYAGKREHWSDETPVVVLQREKGDSSHLEASRAIEGFEEVDREAAKVGRWRVLYRDSAMHDALMSTAGAIGLIDLGTALGEDLEVRVFSLDGVYPSEDRVRDGSYPMAKRLAFVLDDDAGELAAAFLRFVFSAAGRAIIREKGYIPLEEGSP